MGRLSDKARELRHAEVLLVEGAVYLLHLLLDSVSAHHVAVARHALDRLRDEVPGILLYDLLLTALHQTSEGVVAVVLIAIHDEEIARRFADADANDVLAVFLELGDEAGEIGIAREQNERADLRSSEDQLHCVDGESNVGRVFLRRTVS